ncbi:MAG: DUF1080 domain-containing protein [Flavobacteriaceae bacterium]|nr:MAG: DUF1080 domain-containing protein [Flavobacteriaceae bacterium]
MRNYLSFIFSIFIFQSIFSQETLNSEFTNLFNGQNLDGWHLDVPKLDKNPNLPNPFVVRDGMLTTLAKPWGHIITDKTYQNYRLTLEYRFSGKPKNSGVLVHVSTPRVFFGIWPKSIECQMLHKNVGDLYCIGENVEVPDMVARRGPEKKWGVDGFKARRIKKLVDAEKPAGEWNTYVIECFGNEIKVWLNGTLVTHGFNLTATSGQIALQAEGSEVEFRKVVLQPISKLSH